MMFRNHLVVASAVYAVIISVGVNYFGYEFRWNLVTGYLFVLAGCCLPDIDYPSSTVGRRVKWLSWPIYVVFGHRGITHSAIILAAIFLTGWYFQFEFMYWIGLGWSLHLLGDYLTDSGIPLFWPSKKRFRFPVYASTNSLSEPVMVCIISIASIMFIVFI